MEERRLKEAIAALEAQRDALGDGVVDAAVDLAREKLAALKRKASATEQRKQATVLYADLVGYMSMTENMDPEDVQNVLDAYFGEFIAVVRRFGGMVVKLIGDATVAVFGVPTARECDPENAIWAAVAMQQALEGLNQDLEPDLGIRLRMRIGVSTGLVLARFVQECGEEPVSLIGEAVNLACRLQQIAPAGSILISHSTYRHVQDSFEVRPLGALSVKGRTDPVRAYTVLRARPRIPRAPGWEVEGVEPRLTGRDFELHQLEQGLMETVETEEAHTIALIGEPGLGKSRLLYEFGKSVDRLLEDSYFLQARADRRLARVPYSLIRDLFAYGLGIRDSDPVFLARHKLEQAVVSLMGRESLDKAHFIGHLIGFDFSESPHIQGMSGGACRMRRHAFRYMCQFLGDLAVRKPVVMLLDDLQWADDGSLGLIEYLVQECCHLPVLVVGAARPQLLDRRPQYCEEPGWCMRLELTPLSREETYHLVEEILQRVDDLPRRLCDWIVERAQGNPFYVEELIKVLIDDGVIVRGPERWRTEMERLERERISPTLTGVLQARLDALPPAERKVLQRASVVGRVFWGKAVERVGEPGRDEEDQTTYAALERLCERELIFEHQTSAFEGTCEYTFKHALLRDVVHDSVLRSERARYHIQVAQWLIEQSGGRVEEHVGLIAEHYEQAGIRSLAAKWYGRAARQAQEMYLLETAARHYQKALDLLSDGSSQMEDALYLDYYDGLGEVLCLQARFREALEAYRAMREVAEAVGDRMAQAHAWNRVSMVQSALGRYRTALESAQQAEEVARSVGPRSQLAVALCVEGWMFYRLGDVEAAQELGERALEISTALAAKHEIGESLNLLAAVNNLVGRHREAVEYEAQALKLYRELRDRKGIGCALNNLGELARLQGDCSRAIPLYQEALAIARGIGDRRQELLSLSNLSGARIRLGRCREAERDLRRVIDVLDEYDEALDLAPVAYRYLAEVLLEQGNVGEALSAAQRALEFGQEGQAPEFIGMAWRTLGRVVGHSPQAVSVDGEICGAADCFEEALRVFVELGAEAERARTLQAWAEYEIQKGDKEEGARMWQEARAAFEQLGLELEVARMDREGDGLGGV